MTDGKDRTTAAASTASRSGDRAEILRDIQETARQADAEARSETAASQKRRAEAAPIIVSARSRRRRTFYCAALLALCGLLSGINLSGHGPLSLRPPPPGAGEIDRRLRSSLYMVVMDIEAYRGDHGSLPEGLADVGITGPSPLTYEILAATRYVLTLSGDGRRMRYDSGRTPESFFAGLPTGAGTDPGR